jgi:hypothetical protein
MSTNNSELQRVKKVIKWLIFKDYADNETDLAKLLGYTKSYFSFSFFERYRFFICDAVRLYISPELVNSVMKF